MVTQLSAKPFNVGPLGLAAFAMTTTILSCFNAGILPKDAMGVVIPLAFVYGGIMQVITGWWEARLGSTFGFIAFSSYGAFWLYFGMANILATMKLITVNAIAAGIVLLLWGFLTFYLWISSLRLNKTTMLIFLFLTITFIVLGIGDIIGSMAVSQIGGVLGFITAAFAWYGSLATVINDTYGEKKVPLGEPFVKK